MDATTTETVNGHTITTLTLGSGPHAGRSILTCETCGTALSRSHTPVTAKTAASQVRKHAAH